MTKNFARSLPFLFFSSILVALSCAPGVRSSPGPYASSDAEPASDPDGGRRLLKDVARAASSAGAGSLKLLAFSAGTPGDRIDGLVHVPEGTCVLISARASGAVDDLDLHVYGDDGSPFGVDESPDDLPTLLLCPETQVRLYASARIAQGHGLVALGVQSVPKDLAPKVAKAIGARNFGTDVQDLEEDWPGLDDALTERRAALGGAWTDRRRVALPVDSRVPTHLTVDVPKERCLDVLLLPSDEVAQVQVVGLDHKGRLFSRGQNIGAQRGLLLCSAREERSVTLEVRPYSGRGVAILALSISRAPLGTLDLHPSIEPHLVDEGTPPPDHAELHPPETKRLFRLGRGIVSSWETKLRGCTRIDLIPDANLLGFLVHVWSETGDLLAEGNSQRGLPLFVCAQGNVRLDAEAVGRAGELTVELRPSEENLPHLLAVPLAASRLLGQAYASGALRAFEDIGLTRRIELSDTKLNRIPLSIPVAHCQTVFLASDRGAAGLFARIIDDQTGGDLDRAQGRSSVVLRACASRGSHLNATLEVRSQNGKTEALFASRQVKLAH